MNERKTIEALQKAAMAISDIREALRPVVDHLDSNQEGGLWSTVERLHCEAWDMRKLVNELEQDATERDVPMLGEEPDIEPAQPKGPRPSEVAAWMDDDLNGITDTRVAYYRGAASVLRGVTGGISEEDLHRWVDMMAAWSGESDTTPF